MLAGWLAGEHGQERRRFSGTTKEMLAPCDSHPCSGAASGATRTTTTTTSRCLVSLERVKRPEASAGRHHSGGSISRREDDWEMLVWGVRYQLLGIFLVRGGALPRRRRRRRRSSPLLLRKDLPTPPLQGDRGGSSLPVPTSRSPSGRGGSRATSPTTERRPASDP